MNRNLYIVAAVSNPLIWKSRIALAKRAISSWLKEPHVYVTVVECVYGNRDYELNFENNPLVTHVKVKSNSLLWNKENLMNIGAHRLPHDAQYIVFADADIIWRKEGWAQDIINELDLHPVIQTFEYALDLGPNDEVMSVHKSFGALHVEGKPVVPRFDEKMNLTNSPYSYPHPGFSWGYTRHFLDHVGGLFEQAGVGSGDHHQALSLVGAAHRSIPGDVNEDYKNLLFGWQMRARSYPNLKIGFSKHTIEHFFHGAKRNRGYNNRWKMFVNHRFSPTTDIKRNSYGVLEFVGNKPELEREWHQYLAERREDSVDWR